MKRLWNAVVDMQQRSTQSNKMATHAKRVTIGFLDFSSQWFLQAKAPNMKLNNREPYKIG
jgi:hypothetical protein